MKGAQSIQETVRLKRMQKSAFVFNIIKTQNKELKIVHIAFCPPILSCSNLSISGFCLCALSLDSVCYGTPLIIVTFIQT